MRKDKRNVIIAIVAACVAISFVLLALLALYPSASSRYVDEERYAGEVVTGMGGTVDHGNHDDDSWTAVSGSAVSITEPGKYYLSGDLTGGLKVTANGTSSSRAEVDICLNGHVTDGTGAEDETALLLGTVSNTASYLDVYLYDCGGKNEWNTHYYRYGDAKTLADGSTVYKGYDFSDASSDDFDGYIRGGLITGGKITDNGYPGSSGGGHRLYGAGVTVGNGVHLYMYGGTVAGNAVDEPNSATNASAGVEVYKSTFYMYGGTIEGNYSNVGTTSFSAGGVRLDVYDATGSSASSSSSASFCMYGGEVKNNFNEYIGGGVSAYYNTGNSSMSFYMYGGLIEGNYSANDGGGVAVGRNSSSYHANFYMYDGTIRGNIAEEDGGGVLVRYANDKFYLYGGTIEGNASMTGVGGGVYRVGDLTIQANSSSGGGPVYIYGNHAKGKISNVCFSSSSYSVSLGKTLEEGSLIGVTPKSVEAGATIATGTSVDYVSGSLDYFVSDDRGYGIALSGSSLVLYAKPSL